MKHPQRPLHNKAFTLVELLVVIAIIALLSSIVLVVFSSTRARARDTKRATDLSQISKALAVYDSYVEDTYYGEPHTVYTSLPDTSPDCTTWSLPTLQAGWSYKCVLNTQLHAVDGSGWIPVNFENLKKDSFLRQLPVDPINIATSYYSYIPPQNGDSLAISASLIELPNSYIQVNENESGFTIGSQTAFNVALAPVTQPATVTDIAIGNSGSSVTPGISTSGNQLAFTAVTSFGAGALSTGPALSSAPGTSKEGGHAIKRPDGKFLIIHAGDSSGTSIYDPMNDTMVAGPAIVGTAGQSNASVGSHAIERPDGTFLIITGGNKTSTSVYNPTLNTMSAGPALTGLAGAGSHSVKRPDGKYLIFIGRGTVNSSLYDPTNNTIAAGRNFNNQIGSNGFSLRRPDLTYLNIAGGLTQNTNYYNPFDDSTSVGPALGSGQNIGAGAHALQRPDGTFLIIIGNSVNTRIYSPVPHTISAGPAFGGSIIGYSSFSLLRSDGKYLIARGGGGAETYIYDPTANTFSAGPNMPYTISLGAGSLQRPDGKYLIYAGNGTQNTIIYDAGWTTSGVYTTEDLSIPTLNASSTLQYVFSGNGSALAEVKTATTQEGLTSASYSEVAEGGNINPTTGALWAKVRITLTRPVPNQLDSNVFNGSNDTKYLRTFSTPTISGVQITNE